jgi:metallo-beta-lactamase class B
VKAARAAAGSFHPALFDRLCGEFERPPVASNTPPAPRPAQVSPPPKESWYAEPVKVFDNLYFVGQSEYSAWAVTTSAGIILIDTIFDYSVEAGVVDGLKKLGLDPSTIRYAIVSHGHADHHGGAKYLQDRFGTKIVMSAADWELVGRNARTPAPKRDVVAGDRHQVTLGDTTVTLFLTPGHTLGTLSTLLTVKDKGAPHVAAAWGGTAFNFARSADRFQTYINSAERFRSLAEKAGADVIIANHTDFDGTKTKVPALAGRKTGERHPYVIGADGVRRYMTVAAECARAGLANLGARP